MDLRVIQVEETGCVWISIASREKLRQLEIEAVEFVSSLSACRHQETSEQDEPPPPNRGQACLVYWHGKWSRAQVQRLYRSSKWNSIVETFLCDYGVTITVPLSNLIIADSAPFALEPPLVRCYHLSPPSAQPVPLPNGKLWSDSVMEVLREVGGISDEWGTLLRGSVREDGSIQLSNSIEGQEVNINQLLVSKGLLSFTEEEDNGEDDMSLPPLLEEEKENEESYQSPLLSDSTRLSITSPKSEYLDRLVKYLPPRPKSSTGVFIEGHVSEKEKWLTLEDTPFDPAICRALKERGFRFPTPIQSHSWPIIWSGHDTFLCSPHNSGKTLSYLLPLLCSISQKKCTTKDNVHSYEPKIIVLVSDSYKVWNINEQAKTILCWFDAAKRFKTCALYSTVESDALIQILNGVDIVVATPTALNHLMNKNVLTLQNTQHLVFDSCLSLIDKFSLEIEHILKAKGMQASQSLQLVVCSSSYSFSHWNIFKQCMAAPVTIATDVLEVLVMKSIKMKALFCQSEHLLQKTLNLVKRLPSNDTIVVCVRNEEESLHLLQSFSLHCLDVCQWTDGNLPLTRNIAIISDSNIEDILLYSTQPIQYLVHYTLPADKSAFKRRVSLLLPSINQAPSQLLLLTQSCQEQSRNLLSLLRRLGDTPPPELVSMAMRKLEEQKRADPLRDICLQMKCFGKCQEKECHQVHCLDEIDSIKRSLLSPPPLPKDGIVKVLVESVNSPCHLWVRILSHTPLHRGEPPLLPTQVHLSHIAMDLALYYSDHTHRILHTNLSVGDYCGLLNDNGSYYRVLILEFSQPLGLFFHHKERAKVRLIDTGFVDIVDVNQLYSLPATFLATPPLVIEAFLCRLMPPDNDTSWPPSSVFSAQDMMEGHTLTGGVVLSLKGGVWLDPVEERLMLQKVGVVTAVEKPQKRLLESGLAIVNPDHLISLRSALATDESPDRSDQSSFVTPPTEHDVHVQLTAVESPSHFYVQLKSAKEQLAEISLQLNELPYSKLLYNLCTFHIDVGVVCAARFPFDDKWYRVLVMEKREDESRWQKEREWLCFFADYGDLEWVNEKYVQPIGDHLLELPFQAICCSLNGSEEKVFNENVQEVLWDLTHQQTLSMKIVDSNHAFSSTPFPPATQYCVDLLTEDETDVLTLLLNTDRHSYIDEDSPSDITLILNLLLSDEGETVASDFLPFVLAQHGSAVISETNCDQLIEYLSEDYNRSSSDIIDALSLIASINSRSCSKMAAHKELCQSLLTILKRSTNSDYQLSLAQFLHILLLTEEDIALSYENLLTILCDVYCSSTGYLQSTCLDIIASLVVSKKVSLPTEFAESVFGLEEEKKKNSRFLNGLFACSLLHSEEGCRTIAPYLPSILSSFSQHNTEFRVSLLLSLFISTYHFPQLVRFHSSSLAALGSRLSQIEADIFESIVRSLPSIGSLASPINEDCGIEGNDEGEELDASLMDHLLIDLTGSIDRDSGFSSESFKGSSTQIELSKGSSTQIELSKGSSTQIEVSKGSRTELLKDSSQCLTPSVLWSQTSGTVTLNIPLRGCEYCHIDHKDSTVAVWCVVEEKQYQFSLELFGNIEKFDISVSGGEVLVKLVKEHLSYWPRLTNDRNRPSFVGLDHDRWRESSSCSSDDDDVNKTGVGVSLPARQVENEYLNLSFESEESNSAVDSEADFEEELLDFLPS